LCTESAYNSFIERIEDGYIEIDSEVTIDLKKFDAEYADMWHEMLQIQADFPMIVSVLEGTDAISLTADEHKALRRYLDLKRKIDMRERQQIYFRGHTDSFAYLKRISVI